MMPPILAFSVSSTSVILHGPMVVSFSAQSCFGSSFFPSSSLCCSLSVALSLSLSLHHASTEYLICKLTHSNLFPADTLTHTRIHIELVALSHSAFLCNVCVCMGLCVCMLGSRHTHMAVHIHTFILFLKLEWSLSK